MPRLVGLALAGVLVAAVASSCSTDTDGGSSPESDGDLVDTADSRAGDVDVDVETSDTEDDAVEDDVQTDGQVDVDDDGAVRDVTADTVEDSAADSEDDAPVDSEDDAIRDGGDDAADGSESDAEDGADGDVATDADAAGDGDAESDGAATDTSADASSAVRGECKTDDECGAGRCLRVPDHPEGWGTCEREVSEATFCLDDGEFGSLDECCTSAECTAGTNGLCHAGEPPFYCGGPAPMEHNRCLYDECETDDDCTASEFGVCVPVGAWHEQTTHCVYGTCRFDDDCTDGDDARCTPFFDPCRSRFIGFGCSYADSACRGDDDCSGSFGGYCSRTDDGHNECREFHPPP